MSVDKLHFIAFLCWVDLVTQKLNAIWISKETLKCIENSFNINVNKDIIEKIILNYKLKSEDKSYLKNW